MAKYKIVETKEGRFVEVTTTKPYLIEGKIIEKGKTLLINEKGILGSLDGEYESIANKARMARIKKAMAADVLAKEEVVDEPSIDPVKKPMKKMDAPAEIPEEKEELEGMDKEPPVSAKEAMKRKLQRKMMAKKAMDAEEEPEEEEVEEEEVEVEEPEEEEDLEDLEDEAEEEAEDEDDGVDVEVVENEEGEPEVEISFEEPQEEITISAMRKMMLAKRKMAEEPEVEVEEPKEEVEVEEPKKEMRRPLRRMYKK